MEFEGHNMPHMNPKFTLEEQLRWTDVCIANLNDIISGEVSTLEKLFPKISAASLSDDKGILNLITFCLIVLTTPHNDAAKSLQIMQLYMRSLVKQRRSSLSRIAELQQRGKKQKLETEKCAALIKIQARELKKYQQLAKAESTRKHKTRVEGKDFLRVSEENPIHMDENDN